jgi:phosphomannomutase
MLKNIDKSIFKAYDIRGIYGESLFDELAEMVGRAFSVIVKPETVIVGRDARISSPVLHQYLIRGLRAVGVNVIDVGMVSTDMYYYACATKDLPGIMVTASHNPKEYNGFKMVKKIPQLLSGEEGIQDIYQLIADEKLPGDAEKEGSLETWDIMDEFVEKILSLADSKKFKKMKLVVDTSNGMVGPSFVELFKKIPQIEYIPMYFEPDGTFPNHGGDPLQEENRRELQVRVVSEGADLGLTFDPDGDRFFCIDSTGRFVSGDFLTAIMAEYFLEKNPGAAIVYDIRASHAVPNIIEKAGGKAFYNRVGHAFIKKRMMEENAVFGGEVTGHYYFKDYFMCDSGLAPVMYLLDLLSQKEESLAEIVDKMEEIYFISGEINTKGVDKDKVFKLIEEKYGPTANEIIRVDGLTMEYDNWHFNVRASNTEPLVRLNLEADSKKLMEEKRDEVLAVIKSCI